MSSRYSEAFLLGPSNGGDGITPITSGGNRTLWDGTTVLNAAALSVAVPVFHFDAYGIGFWVPGGSTLVGTLTIEASCDRGNLEQNSQPDATIGGWTPISVWDEAAGAQAANKAVASGANNIIIGERYCLYRWVRLRFAFTSGTGSPKVTMQSKGTS